MFVTPKSLETTTVQAAYFSFDRPMHVQFTRRFKTEAEALAYAAQFPKSYNFKMSTCYGVRNGESCIVDYGVSSWIKLAPTKGNDRNETGIKRYHAIMKKMAALGEEVVFEAPALNQYRTREAFESAIS